MCLSAVSLAESCEIPPGVSRWHWHLTFAVSSICGRCPLCRQLLRAITMTACDLCAMTKSWHVQIETVKVIYAEFYEQVTDLCQEQWTMWSVCLQTSGFVSPIFLLSVVAASLSLCFFMFGHSTCGVFLDCFLCAPCSVNQPTYFLLCTFFRRCIRCLSIYSFTCLLKPTQNNVQNYVSLACVLLWKNTIH